MDYLLRKSIGSEWNHPKKEARRAATRNVTEAGHLSPFEFTSYHNLPWVLDTKLQDLMFVLYDLSIALAPFLSILLFLHFGKECLSMQLLYVDNV